MSSLIESYEQQYSVLTAEITADVGKLKLSKSEDRGKLVRVIESSFEEANDLLEQLELEIRGSGQNQLVSRLACYRAELARIKAEFQLSKQRNSVNSDVDEYYEGWNITQEQKEKLLDNSEKIEKSGKKLNEGYKILLETEEIGASVLNDLNLQRETIQRSRNRLRETDENLNRSSRIMSSMITKATQQKFILVMCFIFFIIVISVTMYLSLN